MKNNIDNTNSLHYDKCADSWNEALPIGNGRLGAMIFGSVKKEQFQLNEDSVWHGGYRDRNNLDALKNLPAIRQLIKAGKIQEAEKLMVAALSGTPQGMRLYQPLGELFLTFDNHEAEPDNYSRCLDISNAIHVVSYCMNGYQYTREAFCSNKDNLMVIHMETDNPDGMSFTTLLKRGKFYDHIQPVSIDDNKHSDCNPCNDHVTSCHSAAMYMSGKLGGDGLDFGAMIRLQTKDGTVQCIGEQLWVNNAASVTIYLDGTTSFRTDNILNYLNDNISHAISMDYEALKLRHIEDYRQLYDRVHLTLSSEGNAHPVHNICNNGIHNSDIHNNLSLTDMCTLYFNYGRYLLISCSRPGCLPANLQGLWNKDIAPAWDSKYTININTEMNYWPAEICNLSECHMPLFDLIKRMLPHGQVTAQKMYGCRGFVAHHNTDIWGDTAVQDWWVPGSYWVMGAAWLCTHIYTHYAYTLDKEFLSEFYPIMKEAATFFMDFLIEDHGYLKTCPSVSPENRFILPNGESGSNSIGVTMDNQILRDLFSQCVHTATILDKPADEITSYEEILNRLMPTRIGKHGQIMEWSEDYEEKDMGHRHISHLYGLHPSSQITPDTTPELAAAAKVTLERRLANGGGHTGWSRAWIINDYAKLFDGNNALKHLQLLFEKSTLPNLLDNHPPFQIDGNFGATAAIALMLVQSRDDCVILLPALPDSWSSGSVCGLCLRGGATIDISWHSHTLTSFTIHARQSYNSIIKYGNNAYHVDIGDGEDFTFDYKLD